METELQNICYDVIISTKRNNSVHKYVTLCTENLKKGEVNIIGRNYAIPKAFSVLEVLKEKNKNILYEVLYNNLEARGPNRRSLLEVHIHVKADRKK